MTKKTKHETAHPVAVTTARKLPGRPFERGAKWAGNAAGRPKGSKHKLSEEFIAALCEDFEQHGVETIRRVREERPHEYLKVVAGILPKELNVRTDALEELSDDELAAAISVLQSLIGGNESDGGPSSVN